MAHQLFPTYRPMAHPMAQRRPPVRTLKKAGEKSEGTQQEGERRVLQEETEVTPWVEIYDLPPPAPRTVHSFFADPRRLRHLHVASHAVC